MSNTFVSHVLAAHFKSLAFASTFALGAAAFGQSCGMENLGNLGGASTSPKATTRDCKTVVGVAQIPGPGVSRGFYWRENEGISEIPPMMNEWWGNSFPTAVSFDGSKVVGYGYRNIAGQVGAFRYDRASNTTTQLPVPNFSGSTGYIATAVSSDGSIVFGSHNFSESGVGIASWMYSTEGGYTFISAPGVYPRMGLISAVSDHDQLQDIVAVGTGYLTSPTVGGQAVAMRWTQAGGVQALQLGGVSSMAFDVSNDGSVIVGLMEHPTEPGAWAVYRWTAATGPIVLGISAWVGGNFAKPVAVSGDGLTVVFVAITNYAPPYTPHLLEWTQSNGLRDMGVFEGGPTTAIQNWQYIAGLSDFGNVLVGMLEADQAIRTRRDSDGDGIFDDWEINGVPYVDQNGVAQRFVIDADGDGDSDADPCHKDLFVEVDAMTGQNLTSLAIDPVTAAFADAPLNNPDGTTGIRLHTIIDELDLPVIAQWPSVSATSCWPASFDAYRSAFFGSSADRLEPARVQARSKAMRYTIIADRAENDWGGCGELPGDNTVIYGGAFAGQFDIGTAWMHELGHNLGLDHGGGDDINGKPNYPSIMNYAYGYQSSWNEEFWLLDFSRANSSSTTAMRDIDESCTHENVPIGPSAGRYESMFMPYSTERIVDGVLTRVVEYVSLGGAFADFNANGEFDSCTASDLNFLNVPSNISLPNTPSPGEVMQSHDDWATVERHLAPRGSLGEAAAAPGYPEDEPTSESIAWIRNNFPPPPGSGPNCDSIDFNNDTSLFDPQDIDAFLSVYSEGPCIPEAATCSDIDFNNDGSVFDPCDIDAFLLQFSEGPCTLCGE
ncbi:MAG: M66 family metalloprotease [Phycisphaerales bacterium]